MNILFLTKGLDLGGIQAVTVFLANAFTREGFQVDIAIFIRPQNEMLRKKLCDDVPLHLLHGYSCSKDNVQKLRKILIERNVQIVINQYGLPYIPIRLLKKACKNLNVKIISVYHSDPLANARVKYVEQQLIDCQHWIKNIELKIKKKIYTVITRGSMSYVYRRSNRYVLLSDSFKGNFELYTHIHNSEKLVIIPNPVTIDAGSYRFQPEKKKKNILYVGRVERIVKRVDRILETWRLLEKKYNDWNLYIVGDGDATVFLKDMALDYNLQNVHFEGFQDPRRYYEEASLILLTSDFEGFGLSLVEGMTYGTVPIAYASYSALYDIIDDKKNGLIVPKVNGTFSIDLMAEKLSSLMSDKKMRNEMMYNAINKSKKYNIDRVIKKWAVLFDEIME